MQLIFFKRHFLHLCLDVTLPPHPPKLASHFIARGLSQSRCTVSCQWSSAAIQLRLEEGVEEPEIVKTCIVQLWCSDRISYCHLATGAYFPISCAPSKSHESLCKQRVSRGWQLYRRRNLIPLLVCYLLENTKRLRRVRGCHVITQGRTLRSGLLIMNKSAKQQWPKVTGAYIPWRDYSTHLL